MFDILIINGRIVDGSGNPWYYGDVGVSGGKIAAIGKLDPAVAAKVIDAEGQVVCPGFIDVHVHSDVMLLAEPRHEPKVRQGVTTELLGQDGLSYAPLSPRNLQMMRRYLSGLNGDPDIAWDWTSVGDFLSRFDGKTAVNVAYLIPHCALRVEAMGWANRLPTKVELDEMKKLAAQGMADGAVGFSTGLTYAPGCYSNTKELIEICKVIAQHGGIYVTHLRDYRAGLFEALDEALEIGEKAGIAVHFSHFRGRGRSEQMLAKVDEARERGLDVTIESYPYFVGSGMLQARLPTWVHEGGPEAILEKLSDPEARKRIKEDIHRRSPNWSKVFICGVESESNKNFEGYSIAELSARLDKEPVDFICDLLLEERLAVSHMVFGDDEEEEDVRRIMTHHAHMVGSDSLLIGGKPNPRTYGTYPRYLGRYVRELGILTLEDCIRKMTSLPAQRLGLQDRGLLREGLAADIVIFDPDTVIDKATFEAPRRYPEGILYVLVNGELVVADGQHTGTLPGRALKPLL